MDGPPSGAARPSPGGILRRQVEETSSSSSSSSSSTTTTTFDDKLDSIAASLSSKRNIIVLVGAGISVSAGIPDFRSANGLYNTLDYRVSFPPLLPLGGGLLVRFFVHGIALSPCPRRTNEGVLNSSTSCRVCVFFHSSHNDDDIKHPTLHKNRHMHLKKKKRNSASPVRRISSTSRHSSTIHVRSTNSLAICIPERCRPHRPIASYRNWTRGEGSCACIPRTSTRWRQAPA